MHRLMWSGLVYALAAAVLVASVDPNGPHSKRAFGLYPGQSPFALSAALPAIGIASYVSIALIDLAG